jgi:acyl carrier protein
MGAILLDDFAACLSVALAPSRGAMQRTLAPLVSVFQTSTRMPALSELTHKKMEQIVPTPIRTSAGGALTNSLHLHLKQAVTARKNPLPYRTPNSDRVPRPPAQRQPHVLEQVASITRNFLSSDTALLNADAPLIEAGIDSLAATEVASQLGSAFDISLPPTLLFERSTIRAISVHISERVACSTAMPSLASDNMRAQAAWASHEIALHHVSSRCAGSIHTNNTMCDVLDSGGDAIVRVPAQRWLPESTPGEVQFGGFMADVQRFDALAFFPRSNRSSLNGSAAADVARGRV